METEGRHSKTSVSEASFFQKTFCASWPLASVAAVSAERWQRPDGPNVTQPGCRPAAETTGRFSQALPGARPEAESFGGAALLVPVSTKNRLQTPGCVVSLDSALGV